MEQNILRTLLLVGLTVLTIQALANPQGKSNRLPAFLKICYRDSPNLNACARAAFKSLKPHLLQGIPELYIPPMEPLVVPEIKMDQDSGAIYLHSVYKNVKISGMSDHIINDLTIDPSKHKLFVSLTFPILHLDSKYNIKGKIMMMPLLGEGHCAVDIKNITIQTELFGEEYKKNDVTFLKINDIKVKYDLSHIHIQLDNLFNGDKALGQRMNDFLNENWKSLSDEVRPLINNALKDILNASVKKLFDEYSYDELLPLLNG